MCMLTPNVVTFRQVQDFKTHVVVPIRSIILMKFQERYNVVSMFYRLSCTANKSRLDFSRLSFTDYLNKNSIDKVLSCKSISYVHRFYIFYYIFNIVNIFKG